MQDGRLSSRALFGQAVRFVLLFSIYFITAKLGLKLGAVNGFATLVWPPSGIALAALLIWGTRFWPAIALAAFLANWSLGAPPSVSLAIAAGNSLEAVCGAFFLRWTGFSRSMDRLWDVFALVVLAGLLSPLTSATIGTTSLLLGGMIARADFGATWSAWWFGDLMGVLLIAPVFLVWSAKRIQILEVRHRLFEHVALILAVAAGSIFIFTDWFAGTITDYPKPFFIYPIFMIVAVRLGQAATVTSLLISAVIALSATIAGHGRFWIGTLSQALFQAQIYFGVLAISKMVLAAVVTERKKERNALKGSNAQREAILNSALDSIVTFDHQGKIMEFNPAAEKTFGYLREDVIGKEMASLIAPPLHREEFRKGILNYQGTCEGSILGKLLEMAALRADGTLFPIELSILALEIEGPPMFTGFIQDITKRKQAEAEKRMSEASQKFLSDATGILAESIDYVTTLKRVTGVAIPGFGDHCVVQILGIDGKIQHVAFSSGLPDKVQVIQEAIDGFLSDLDSPTLIASVVKTKRPQLVTTYTEEIYRPHGMDPRILDIARRLEIKSMMICPLFSHEKVLGAISLVSSNAERKYGPAEFTVFEELARRAAISIENARLYQDTQEAVQARDEFLSIASHELKTPLTSLKLQAQIRRRHLDKGNLEQFSPDKIRKMVSDDETQVNRLGRLIDDMLDISRLNTGKFQLKQEKVDLRNLVQEVADRFLPQLHSIGVRLDTDAPNPVVGSWDRYRMEQVFINLLTNSMKYGSGKPIYVAIREDGPMAKLIVRDEGLGIEIRDQERIFHQFERAISATQISGLGLGLYIVKQIVEGHGGRISVESELGHGSTFTVELPKDFDGSIQKGALNWVPLRGKPKATGLIGNPERIDQPKPR